MQGPVELLAVVLFLLGCYGLAIGILQVLGFVPLPVSQSFRFLGASGLGNIIGGLGALALAITFPLAQLLGRPLVLTVVAASLALVGLSVYLSERRRRTRPGPRQ
jgi:predicted membrane-bound spermidine synthase